MTCTITTTTVLTHGLAATRKSTSSTIRARGSTAGPIEALIRAANETRITAVFSNEPPLVRIHPAALKAARVEAPAEQSGPTPEVAASRQADASVATRPFSWIRAIALLVAAIVLSVIIYFAAGMIAGHPWSAALVGVPLALYLKYRK